MAAITRQIYLADLPLAEGENFIKVRSLSTGLDASEIAQLVAQAAGQLDWILSDDGSYFICGGIGEFVGQNLVIPAEYAGKPVREIAEYAFEENKNIRSVTIPHTVNTIGRGAFKYCTNLTSLIIDDMDEEERNELKSKIYIRNYSPLLTDFKLVFFSPYESNLIKDMTVEPFTGVDDHGEYTVYSVSLPSGAGVENIEFSAIYTNPNEELYKDGKRVYSRPIDDDYKSEFYAGIYEINPYAPVMSPFPGEATKELALYFVLNEDGSEDDYYNHVNLSRLAAITVPPLKIRAGAFENTAIYKIHFPSRVNEIGDSAFQNSLNLNEVTFAENSLLAVIGHSAFQNCSWLRKFVIPSGVSTIGMTAFAQSGLRSIEIPMNVGSIGASAFSACAKLETAIFHSGYIPSIMGTPDVSVGATNIPGSIFKDCTKLSTVVLPMTAKTIGDNAFNGCEALTSITIPLPVTNIGINAFNGCTALTSAIFEDIYGWFNTESNYDHYQNHKGSTLVSQPEWAAQSLTQLYNGSATYRWFKIDQMLTPTISAENSILTVTDPTGIAEEFKIYVGDKHRATYNIATGELTLV